MVVGHLHQFWPNLSSLIYVGNPIGNPTSWTSVPGCPTFSASPGPNSARAKAWVRFKKMICLCQLSVGYESKPWYLVNPKIAGKWMFIPLKMVLIGIDPYPFVIRENNTIAHSKNTHQQGLASHPIRFYHHLVPPPSQVHRFFLPQLLNGYTYGNPQAAEK